MRILLVILLVPAVLSVDGQSLTRSFKLGDSTVTVVVENPAAQSRVLFINVHENEATSIAAFRQYEGSSSYRFAFLRHQGTRRISFNLGGTAYSVDPNRIFSNRGIVATLAYDTLYSRKAVRTARDLADGIRWFVRRSSWTISLHNNTPDNYSILSYLPGQPEAPNAKDVYVNELMDPDDFIYTTHAGLFQHLKKAHINVILQDNKHCIDDGSLSVWCGKHRIPYANVEAEEGHLMEQIDLIAKIVEAIDSL